MRGVPGGRILTPVDLRYYLAGLPAVAIVTVAAGLVWRLTVRKRVVTLRRAAVAAVVVAAAVGVATVAVNPSDCRPTGPPGCDICALSSRRPPSGCGPSPWFGVGVGQYGLRFQEFSSAELLRYYARADAHNYLLWIAAEFGALGLAAFLPLLAAALA